MWCVVHVKDGREERMEDFIVGLLPKSINVRCFHLIRGRRKKYEGQWHTVYEDLFPGYVFIDTDEPDRVYRELKKTPTPKLLFSDDECIAMLEKQESDFMAGLADKNGRIGISKVTIGVDGRVCCLSGPLEHMEDRVKRVNLHKRIAEIEADVMGKKRILYLGIDIEADDRRKAETG